MDKALSGGCPFHSATAEVIPLSSVFPSMSNAGVGQQSRQSQRGNTSPISLLADDRYARFTTPDCASGEWMHEGVPVFMSFAEGKVRSDKIRSYGCCSLIAPNYVHFSHHFASNLRCATSRQIHRTLEVICLSKAPLSSVTILKACRGITLKRCGALSRSWNMLRGEGIHPKP